MRTESCQGMGPVLITRLITAACILLSVCTTAEAWEKYTSQQVKDLKSTDGTVIGSMAWSHGHLKRMRGHFNSLGRNCFLVNKVSFSRRYIEAIKSYNGINRTVLYSYTHGRGAENLIEHLFKGLALVTNMGGFLKGVASDSEVLPLHLPSGMDYDFVLMSACHSSHECIGSHAAAFRAPFNANVYVGAIGGPKKVTGGGQRCCLSSVEEAPGFGEEFLRIIVPGQTIPDATFWHAFGLVDADRSKYFTIRCGGDEKIADIFPPPPPPAP